MQSLVKIQIGHYKTELAPPAQTFGVLGAGKAFKEGATQTPKGELSCLELSPRDEE